MGILCAPLRRKTSVTRIVRWSFQTTARRRRDAATGLMVALLLVLAAVPARAEISLLLEEPYGGLGMVTPMGHAALYLDHVCAATPIQLRPCRPGEMGVVISRYDGINNLDWIAIPLIPYLYAVEDPADIPRTVDRAQEDLLRDLYRRHALESVAPDLPDGSAPDGNWYELAGSAYDRKIYGFSMKTTADQDASLIAMFNDRRNVEHYNGPFRNCADFARTTINHIYPHAVRRNFIADFGFTTPKSVARALSRYASKHPRVQLRYFVVPQVPGTLPRSYGVETITEGLLKRYGVPLAVLSPLATGVVFVAYMGHGRFDMPRDAPVLNIRPPVPDEREMLRASEASHSLPATIAIPLPPGEMLPEQPPLLLLTPGLPAMDAPLDAPGQDVPVEPAPSSIQ